MQDNSEEKMGSSRRDFLKKSGAVTAGIVAQGLLDNGANAAPAPRAFPDNPATAEAMPTRNLGRTGYRTGIFSLGGQAAIEQPHNEETAAAIVERALDLGVNYIDTAAQYGGSERWSQRYIGQVMKRRRGQTYLASKTHDRTRDGSLRLLEESLKLLNTDHLDAWQLHHVTTPDDVERIFAKGGAIEALQQAREQKLVRYLGVTGHTDPELLMECLRRFPFDQILLALNAADKHHLSFMEKLLPMAVDRQMGIIGMKIPARGRILSAWKPQPGGYSPFEGPAKGPGTLTMKEALYYVLSLPVSTVIIGCDSVAQLEENVKLARAFTPLSEQQLAALAEKTEAIARQALFFRRWA
ncbi:MAG: aldo/keto reductase [Acidobacteriia bacterium]|nr:aldo/keto reductase [Terriglobia bacterium]